MDRLAGYDWLKARWADYGKPFKESPVLVVIHSGATAPGVAEYLNRVPDGRKVSAHFSWSSRRGLFVQQVELGRESWHAGGTTWLGRRTNSVSISVELPGPWRTNPRSPRERELLRELLRALCPALPSLRWVVGHEHLSSAKRDPGPGVGSDWFEGLGLDVVWSRAEAQRLRRPAG
jgi:N-acetyl-anhydromuramyl-L-alanine amidase AmpD